MDDAEEPANAEPRSTERPDTEPSKAEAEPPDTEPGEEESAGTEPSKAESAKVTKAWRRWTIGLAGTLALLTSLLLLVGDGFAGVLNNLGGGPPSSGTWLGAAAIGHGVLALASVALLVAGLAGAARRRTASVAAWAIIPAGVGWFVLCGQLAAG